MVPEEFKSDVDQFFPGAALSIDDGESLRFRYEDFDCAARLLATGKWSVGVLDLRGARNYEEAQFDIGRGRNKETRARDKVLQIVREFIGELKIRRAGGKMI